MVPRYHPRHLHEQAEWRILRRRAKMTGKTIEQLLAEERAVEGLTIEPTPVPPPPPAGMTPADLEALIGKLVPAITEGVRTEVVDDLKATLERVSMQASQQTGTYIAQEVARRLAVQGVAVAAPGAIRPAASAVAPASAGAPAAEAPAPPPKKRIAIGDIQSLIDMLNQPRPPQT